MINNQIFCEGTKKDEEKCKYAIKHIYLINKYKEHKKLSYLYCHEKV